MKIALILLAFSCLSGCASMTAYSTGGSDESYTWRRSQVQRDVEAITQGMNHARAQSEAVARARGS